MMEMFVKIRKAGITLVWLVTSLMYAGAQSYSYKPVKGFPMRQMLNWKLFRFYRTDENP